MPDLKITQLTALTAPDANDVLPIVDDPSGTPVTKKIAFSNLSKILQIVSTQTGAVATGTTTVPADDTIPQNTEGTEFMTLAITPTSATTKLRIDVIWNGAVATASRTLFVCLFQDSTADALAAVAQQSDTASTFQSIAFSHVMTSGTTSATTFKVRCGVETSGTVTFNGAAGARYLGGVMASSIRITEYYG